jgi:hypothetical protein
MGSGDVGAAVATAVAATVSGSARVVVGVDMALDEPSERLSVSGIIDFESDRCQLDGDATHLRMVGAKTYQQLDDGRWSWQEGAPGSRGMFHPRWILEALRGAQISSRALSENEFAVELDRVALARLVDAGVSPTWNANARVELDVTGRVCQVTFCLTTAEELLTTAEGSVPSMCVSYELSDFGAEAAVQLPEATTTISLADHLLELDQEGQASTRPAEDR